MWVVEKLEIIGLKAKSSSECIKNTQKFTDNIQYSVRIWITFGQQI